MCSARDDPTPSQPIGLEPKALPTGVWQAAVIVLGHTASAVRPLAMGVVTQGSALLITNLPEPGPAVPGQQCPEVTSMLEAHSLLQLATTPVTKHWDPRGWAPSSFQWFGCVGCSGSAGLPVKNLMTLGARLAVVLGLHRPRQENS